jgi:hypothetical protein
MSEKTNFARGALFYTGILTLITLIGAQSSYLITYEKWPYLGFQFGFIILPALLFTFASRVRSRSLRFLVYFTSLGCIASNVLINNEISLKHALRLEAGQNLTNTIFHDVISSDAYVGGKTKVAFVGSIRFNSNYQLTDPMPDVVSLNGIGESPVVYTLHGMPTLIKSQLLLHGMVIRIVEEDILAEYEAYALAQALPEYPKQGSIVMLDEVLIINLGLNHSRNSGTAKSSVRKPDGKWTTRIMNFVESKI